MRDKEKISVWMWLIMIVLSANVVCAAEPMYHCELGLQGGLGYYVGDGTEHIFNNVREAYGAHFRYKFDQRWSLQVKGQYQRIAFPKVEEEGVQTSEKGSNPLINLDIVGEFNFFRFGAKQYDERVKPITPYIFLGVGVSVYDGIREVVLYDEFGKVIRDEQGNVQKEERPNQLRGGVYFPFGLGMKWKFAPRWQLHLAWQQNLYFRDDIENTQAYNNTYKMNGSNILKNDFTSSLTLGIVFEFAPAKRICHTCE